MLLTTLAPASSKILLQLRLRIQLRKKYPGFSGFACADPHHTGGGRGGTERRHWPGRSSSPRGRLPKTPGAGCESRLNLIHIGRMRKVNWITCPEERDMTRGSSDAVNVAWNREGRLMARMQLLNGICRILGGRRKNMLGPSAEKLVGHAFVCWISNM